MSQKSKASFGFLGRSHTEETKQRMAKSLTGRKHTKKSKNLMSDSKKGVVFSEEHKRRISESCKGRKCSEETKERMARANKKKWENSDYRGSVIRNSRLSMKITPNKSEQKLQQLLDNRFPEEWKFVGDGSFILNGYNPDFINVNGKKQIIELFGDYWHKGEDPADRAKLFEPYGFKTLVIWEHELKNLLSVATKVKAMQK